jgi:hypothetical protein
MHNIYHTISLERFATLKSMLRKSEVAYREALEKKYAVPIASTQQTDFLGVDLHFSDEHGSHYNFAVLFEDMAGTESFEVTVSKSLDFFPFRYFKRSTIANHVAFAELLTNKNFYMDQIELAIGWKKNEMERIELRKGH